MGVLVLVLGAVVVAGAGAVVARVALGHAGSGGGGRAGSVVRSAAAEFAEHTDGRDGVVRSVELTALLVASQLAALAGMGLSGRELAGVLGSPLTRWFARLPDWPGAIPDAVAGPGVVLGVSAAAALVLGLVWPRLPWLPALVLAGVHLLAWLELHLLGVVAEADGAAAAPVRVVAGYGTVLLLTLVGLRMRRLRGLPVEVDTALWLLLAVLAWAVAFGDLAAGRETATATGGGLVLGAWLLVSSSTVAVRHAQIGRHERAARRAAARRSAVPRR